MERTTFYSKQVELHSSLLTETYRVPDSWKYHRKGKKLISDITSKPVEESITTRDTTEFLELEGYLKLEDYCTSVDFGKAIWISPPGRDSDAKVVICHILPDQISLRGICFDWDDDIFFPLARSFGQAQIQERNDFRTNPIPLTPDNYSRFVEIMRILEPRQIGLMESGEDVLIKERIKHKLSKGQNVQSGSYRGSCGPGPFSHLYKDSLKFGRYFKCPGCGELIPSGYQITTCPHCGARKEEFGSRCD